MKKEIILLLMILALIGISFALPAGPGSPMLPGSSLSLNIISPNNNFDGSSGIVNFTFNASSNLDIDKCELIVNNNVVKTVNDVNDSKINYISFTLSTGQSSWKIKCYAGDAVNESSLRIIDIGVVSCSNSCNNNGGKTCFGNGFKTCGDFNNDGCLELSVVTNCGSNQCVSGSCVNNLPLCTEGDWSSSISPLTCPSSGKQLKTWALIGNCALGISHSNENTTCNYQSSCTSFSYSSWEACSSSGVQIRTLISSNPNGCSGGNPVLSQQCSYTPTCMDGDWSSSLSPLTCPSSNMQTKTWTKVGNCAEGVQKTTETINCSSQAVTCTNFTYSDYSECSFSNVQTRAVISKLPVNCSGGNFITSSSCSFSDYLKRVIGFNSEINPENITLSKENSLVVKFEKINNQGLNLTDVLIKEGRENGKYFLIVQRGVASDSKKLYFNLSSASKGICVKDEEISDLSEIKKKCVYIDCPGNKGDYVCARESDGRFLISGLKHSGILEVTDNKCADGICSDSEDCSSCAQDCGQCTQINQPSSGGRVHTRSGVQNSSGTNTNTKPGNPVSSIVNRTTSPVSPGNVDSAVDDIVDDESDEPNNAVWIFVILLIAVVLIAIILIIILVLFRKKKDVKPMNQGISNV